MGGAVSGIGTAWAGSQQASAAEHAAELQHDSSYRAWSLEASKEAQRRKEYKFEQEMAARQWAAWQGARNKFMSERLGFAMPQDSGGPMPTYEDDDPYARARAWEAKKWYNPATNNTGDAPPQPQGAAPPGGTSLGDLGGVTPTQVAPTKKGTAWNDWGGYGLGK